MESAITVKGQVTIPKEARDHLGLKPGDRVKFFIQPDGHVVILPQTSGLGPQRNAAHEQKSLAR